MSDQLVNKIMSRLNPIMIRIIKEELINFFPPSLPLKRENEDDDEDNEYNEENEEEIEEIEEKIKDDKLISILGLDIDDIGRPNIGTISLYTLKKIKEHYLNTGNIILPKSFVDNTYNRDKLKSFLRYKDDSNDS